MPSVLTDEQLQTFWETGVLRLNAAFEAADALHIQGLVWDHLAASGVDRGDPATWLPDRFRGLGNLRRELPWERITRSSRVRGALDELLGRKKWLFGEYEGLLASPPESPRAPWKIARGDWHWDGGAPGPWAPSDAVWLWGILCSLPPRSGGTLLLEGSAALVGEFKAECEARSIWSTRERFREWHPYLRRLYGLDPSDDPREFLSTSVDDVGRRLRVIEITGEPGDMVITQPGILHRVPQHHGGFPRFLSLRRLPAL
jgi:hypothetical protein